MAEEHRFLYDMRDLQFVLYEQLKVERLFELPAFAELDRSSVDLLLNESLRFAQKVLAPANAAGDREGCRYEDGQVFVPQAYHDVYRQQCEAGWMAISTAVEHGGQGVPFTIGAATGEMFVGSNCSLSMIAGLTRAAAELIAARGSEELKKTYLEPMVSGRWGGTMCLTEPHAGSAVGSCTTSAVRRDGQYYVKGQKIFISGGDHDLVENVIHLVLARCEGAPAGTKGLSLFLIPKLRLDENGAPGESNDVACVGIEEKMGIHGSPTCAMSFGENDGCIGYLIGEENQGIQIMFDMMNGARVGVGLQGVALGSWAYLSALEYARERIQGVDMKNIRDPDAPLVPIVKHPDVRRMLATMKAYVEGGRSLLLHTAMCLDLMENSSDEAQCEHLSGRVELLTPICKAYCSDTGYEVATLALQTYGGHGYLKDYPVEQLVRDVKIASIYEGTNGIQAIDLLGRKVGRKQGALFMAFMADLNKFIDEHSAHPVLGEAVKTLGSNRQRLEEVTMNFAMQQMSGDVDYPLLSATPYLRMFGNVTVGWLLLEQGVIAHQALDELCEQRGASTPEQRSALCDDNDDAAFYHNKVKTAQFFASNILPQNEGIATAIQSADRSPLEMHF